MDESQTYHDYPHVGEAQWYLPNGYFNYAKYIDAYERFRATYFSSQFDLGDINPPYEEAERLYKITQAHPDIGLRIANGEYYKDFLDIPLPDDNLTVHNAFESIQNTQQRSPLETPVNSQIFHFNEENSQHTFPGTPEERFEFNQDNQMLMAALNNDEDFNQFMDTIGRRRTSDELYRALQYNYQVRLQHRRDERQNKKKAASGRQTDITSFFNK